MPELNVKFISPAAKKKYKVKGRVHHSWNQLFYRVYWFEAYSETGEGFVVLVNDDGEIWWVSNRDVRAIK